MKKKRLQGNYRQNYLLTGIAGLVLSSSHSTFESIDINKNNHSVERKGNSKNHVTNEKKNLIKIVHNPEKKSVRVVVKDIAGDTIDFYVFDMEGTMVVNYKLKSKEKKIITTLEKGAYTYNAFSGDEETDFGKIIIE
ncbi:MAG: T9SS type A sorting domain-containing protein [Bacteroidota bacterium]